MSIVASSSGAAAVRDSSPERECDEYRIAPVSVSVSGPLALRFPGSECAEVSIPSLAADVVVIASMADSHANGETSLGVPRSFIRDAEFDRETGVVTFAVTGVRTFTDSTVRMRAHGGAELGSRLLWLLTGHGAHVSPASDLVTKAANALHALALLRQDAGKAESAKVAEGRTEQRMRRRRLLQERWARQEESERQTAQTRAQFLSPVKDDARAVYIEQLQSMLLKNVAKTPER